MTRILALLCLLSTGTVAVAAGPSTCPERPAAAEGVASDIVLSLDPDTLWRPRGAEVRFVVASRSGGVSVSKVRVCFGWSNPGVPESAINQLVGSTQVRSVPTDNGSVESGAILPVLQPVPWRDWWPLRVIQRNDFVYTGGYAVPVADMVVAITLASGQTITTSAQVGATSVAVGWAMVLVSMGFFWGTLAVVANKRRMAGRTLMLRVVSTPDGYASLSQFQVLLWTNVVGLCAVYVITLSGNLIPISVGTLTLLGIASGSALVARLPQSGDDSSKTPAASGPPASPEWADMLIPNRRTGDIDITRVQMLAFTLISAGFVVVKVIVDYEIPEIPVNFLLLMGISNGVYIGGLRLPNQNKGSGS